MSWYQKLKDLDRRVPFTLNKGSPNDAGLADNDGALLPETNKLENARSGGNGSLSATRTDLRSVHFEDMPRKFTFDSEILAGDSPPSAALKDYVLAFPPSSASSAKRTPGVSLSAAKTSCAISEGEWQLMKHLRDGDDQAAGIDIGDHEVNHTDSFKMSTINIIQNVLLRTLGTDDKIEQKLSEARNARLRPGASSRLWRHYAQGRDEWRNPKTKRSDGGRPDLVLYTVDTPGRSGVASIARVIIEFKTVGQLSNANFELLSRAFAGEHIRAVSDGPAIVIGHVIWSMSKKPSDLNPMKDRLSKINHHFLIERDKDGKELRRSLPSLFKDKSLPQMRHLEELVQQCYIELSTHPDVEWLLLTNGNYGLLFYLPLEQRHPLGKIAVSPLIKNGPRSSETGLRLPSLVVKPSPTRFLCGLFGLLLALTVLPFDDAETIRKRKSRLKKRPLEIYDSHATFRPLDGSSPPPDDEDPAPGDRDGLQRVQPPRAAKRRRTQQGSQAYTDSATQSGRSQSTGYCTGARNDLQLSTAKRPFASGNGTAKEREELSGTGGNLALITSDRVVPMPLAQGTDDGEWDHDSRSSSGSELQDFTEPEERHRLVFDPAFPTVFEMTRTLKDKSKSDAVLDSAYSVHKFYFRPRYQPVLKSISREALGQAVSVLSPPATSDRSIPSEAESTTVPGQPRSQDGLQVEPPTDEKGKSCVYVGDGLGAAAPQDPSSSASVVATIDINVVTLEDWIGAGAVWDVFKGRLQGYPQQHFVIKLARPDYTRLRSDYDTNSMSKHRPYHTKDALHDIANESKLMGGPDSPLSDLSFVPKMIGMWKEMLGSYSLIVATIMQYGGERVGHPLQLTEQQKSLLVQHYEHLHRIGIVHGDAHPRNWLVNHASSPVGSNDKNRGNGLSEMVIIDFGRARIRPSVTSDNAAVAGDTTKSQPKKKVRALAEMDSDDVDWDFDEFSDDEYWDYNETPETRLAYWEKLRKEELQSVKEQLGLPLPPLSARRRV